MADTVQYPLRIERIKPGEMSLLRLGEYLEQFAKLLGSTDRVHLGEIVENCTTVVALVDANVKYMVSPRIRDAAAGRAKGEAASAFQRLNEMVGEDNTTASLPIPGGEVVQFVGRGGLEPEIGPVFETTTIQGTLTRLQDLADGRLGISIRQADGDTVRGDTAGENTTQLLPFFRQFVRATGTGKWRRNEAGRWVLEHFQVSHFDQPAAGTLAEVLAEARRQLLPGDGARMLKALREIRDE